MEKYKKLKYLDFSNFGDSQKQYKDGILTLNLATWDEFHRVVKIFNNNTDYFWRGQANKDWPLVASSDRPDQNYNESVAKCKKPLNSNERRNKQSIMKWTHQQHYGGRTPLLDWTDCPYVAAYFAFNSDKAAEDRVIYALNRSVQRLLLKKKQSGKVLSKDRFVEIIDPHFSEMQNVRSESQKSKFTNDLIGIDIKQRVEELYRRSYKAEEVILAQIIIPATGRDKCLQFLESQKITSETLIPDCSDAGKSG